MRVIKDKKQFHGQPLQKILSFLNIQIWKEPRGLQALSSLQDTWAQEAPQT